jgi:hypothetical protein
VWTLYALFLGFSSRALLGLDSLLGLPPGVVGGSVASGVPWSWLQLCPCHAGDDGRAEVGTLLVKVEILIVIMSCNV